MSKIAKIEPLFIDKFLIVRIETDDGTSGLGEAGAWGHIEASATAVEKFAEYLVGKDPRPIEHHWNVMLRANHFTGAAISGAVSAIDIALWDIKGKQLGVPVHELLGGPMRHKARLYAHARGGTIDALVEEARRLKAEGFTALGHLNPFLDEEQSAQYFKPHARKIEDAVENVRKLREGVGNDVDLCIEIHRRLTPAEAVVFARAIEPYRPMFYEDPIRPGSLDAMAWVTDHIPIPIATGERYVSVFQFQQLLARNGVHYLRPSLGLCGGITGGRKIAAIAEACDAQIVPHNPLSPVILAAELQLDAAIPNFAIQEYPCATPAIDGYGTLQAGGMVTGLPQPVDGFIAIPNAPGLGIELAPDYVERFPRKIRPIRMRPHMDGSLVDQ